MPCLTEAIAIKSNWPPYTERLKFRNMSFAPPMWPPLFLPLLLSPPKSTFLKKKLCGPSLVIQSGDVTRPEKPFHFPNLIQACITFDGAFRRTQRPIVLLHRSDSESSSVGVRSNLGLFKRETKITLITDFLAIVVVAAGRARQACSMRKRVCIKSGGIYYPCQLRKQHGHSFNLVNIV